MNSKLHLRRQDDRYPERATEVEITINGQTITGTNIIRQGDFNAATYFPNTGDNVKGGLHHWCISDQRNKVKLPNEPESAYKRIENMMQLGDAIGCGRTD